MRIIVEFKVKGLAYSFLSVLMSILMLIPPGLAASDHAGDIEEKDYAMQAADILGVRTEVNRVLELQKRDAKTGADSDELELLRGYIFRKIMSAVFDVRVGTNMIERELTYTYELLLRAEAKVGSVSDIFNLLNFLQFGILYALEGRSRLHNQFVQSGVLTCVSAGIGVALPVSNILYGKVARTRDCAPPKICSYIVSGLGVNELPLPKLVLRYLNTPEPGSAITRREKMHGFWKKKYGTQEMTREAMFSLLDGKGKSNFQLMNRIVHLWSLHTFVEDFDYELLALLRLVQSPNKKSTQATYDLKALGLGESDRITARLLGIEPDVAEFIQLRQSGTDPVRRRQLETHILGHILAASLEMRCKVDKIYEELNYTSNVVLSSLLARRAKKLQLIYEANFININTFGANAGNLYLQDYNKAGNMMFLIANAIGLGLTILGVHVERGGTRKTDTSPNTLAFFFNLRPTGDYRYSPLAKAFLDSPDPASKDGRTHKEELLAIWKREKVATININKRKNQEKLAAMPNIKKDNIKIAQNRINLLQGLRIRFELLDRQLLSLLNAASPDTRVYEKSGGEPLRNADPTITATAGLVGLGDNINRIKSIQESRTDSVELLEEQLEVTRTILAAMLEVRTTLANIGEEIAEEIQVRDRMKRYRDKGMSYTNLANFCQIGTFGCINDGPLGYSSDPRKAIYADRLTIIEGSIAILLSGLAFAQRDGGIRLKKAQPNMLGPCFSIDSPARSKYSPLLLRYLDYVDPRSPDQIPIKEELIKYWQQTKVLSLNVGKKANQEKVSATGKSYRWWNRRIKLITTRISMLFDLRSMMSLMERDLAVLLKEVD